MKQESRFVTVCLISSKQRILFGQINLILIWQPVCSNKCAVTCQRVVMTEGCSRYDIKTKEMLTKFLETGKVTAKFADREPWYKNICYLNSTRQNVTQDCCERFTVGKTCYQTEFVYDGNKETYAVCAGMPVLATTNLKTEEIYNMMEFHVEQINDQNVTINGTVFPIGKSA